MPRWKGDGPIAVYGDGHLLYQSRESAQYNVADQPVWLALDGLDGGVPPRQLIIRLQHRRDGGTLSTLWVGDEAVIGWRSNARHWLQSELPAMANAAFLGMGTFAFCVWLRRRERLYLLFFAMSMFGYLRGIPSFAGSQRLPLAEDTRGWLAINAGFWLLGTCHLFFNQFHHGVKPWLTRALLGVIGACALLTLPLPALSQVVPLAPLVYLAIMLGGDAVFLLAFRAFWRAGWRTGMVMAGWGFLSVQSSLYDWLLRTNRVDVEGVFLYPYANVGGFFICTYVMFHRYVDAQRDVEQANAHLELRLHARERELTASHERLRAAEQLALLGQERRRMTQDMHDGLGSTLVSALRVVERGRLDADEVAGVLRGCIDDLKLAIDSMEVVEADLLLLLATLRFRLAPRLDSAGIRLLWEVQDLPALDWLTPGNSLHILRILQEAFANIIKHAQATEIGVATALDNGWVRLSVSNNGRQFDVAQALRSGGKGLANQQRRADAIGAQISWHSDAAGTRLCLRLPLSQG